MSEVQSINAQDYVPCQGQQDEETTCVSTDTTWTLASSPYHFTRNIEVESGVTLTIEPGVDVWIGAKLYFRVCPGASVVAKGTPTQHIAIGRYVDPVTQTGSRWKKMWFYENTTS